ncbi:hypothetical protein BU24DRAFT_127845 [Aaosphaeria arxii CBS 175.79]|uniref:Uncharacterized protein n=1 Tax=Aaosphaeria arxii CBS 175.79 TaxID=1450172 RepID=A0A6A5Y2Q9_9PLEO|nr:uncharacterized protein BU24DRAFT_127845 [Aaosphaeria arxii CBS 175.79]KAF2019832.1 hypothetical protein BU24DRAFT_127845 [Aaosphaeria arxii CBS 175.79]
MEGVCWTRVLLQVSLLEVSLLCLFPFLPRSQVYLFSLPYLSYCDGWVCLLFPFFFVHWPCTHKSARVVLGRAWLDCISVEQILSNMQGLLFFCMADICLGKYLFRVSVSWEDFAFIGHPGSFRVVRAFEFPSASFQSCAISCPYSILYPPF